MNPLHLLVAFSVVIALAAVAVVLTPSVTVEPAPRVLSYLCEVEPGAIVESPNLMGVELLVTHSAWMGDVNPDSSTVTDSLINTRSRHPKALVLLYSTGTGIPYTLWPSDLVYVITP